MTDEELIDMIRAAATEQLPIAVMTVGEMRQFAQEVARDCVRIIEANKSTTDGINGVRNRYELADSPLVENQAKSR